MDRSTTIEIQGKGQFSSTAEVSFTLTLRRSASLDDGDFGLLLNLSYACLCDMSLACCAGISQSYWRASRNTARADTL